MSYAIVTAKVDPKVKKQAQETAEALGMPLSVVIKAFLKQFIKTKTVTFSVYDETPNAYLRSALKKAEQNRKQGKGSPIFDNADEAIAWLEKQGI